MQQPSHSSVSQHSKEPPPYPGHVYTRGFHHTAGYRQSYASSETGSTDMSLSSCENLSTSLRQDPQGEETQHTNMFPGSVEIQQPGYANTYIQGPSPTGVEVKSANSSTFYVTGSVANPTEELNLSSYATVPQVTGPMSSGGQVVHSSALQEPLKPYQQNYQNQYYNDGNNPLQNRNQQVLVQQPLESQPYNHNHQNVHSQNRSRETRDCVQTVQCRQEGTQQYTCNVPNQNQSPLSNSQGNTEVSKEDPFKKWRHFYVNDNTQLEHYRQQLHHDSESTSPEDEGTPYQPGGPLRREPAQSGTPCQPSGPLRRESAQPGTPCQLSGPLNREPAQSGAQYHPAGPPDSPQSGTQYHTIGSPDSAQHCTSYRNSGQSAKQYHQEKPLDTNSLKSSDHYSSSSTFGNGTMIAKLKQEFCKNNPPEHRWNSVSKTREGESRSSLKAGNDRVRSATPDFLSNRLEVSKQLPMRPSSANAKQSASQRLALAKLKPQSVKDTSKNKSPEVLRKHSLSLLNPEGKYESGSKSATFKEKSAEVAPAQCGEHQSEGRPSQWKHIDHQSERPALSSPMFTQDALNLSCETVNPLSGAGPPAEFSKRNRASPYSHESQQGIDTVRDSVHSDRSERTSLDRCRASELDHAAIATRATQMVERLSAENSSLRQELEGYYSKVCRLQKFEVEIQKITDAYESLVKHSTKRENLDKVMRLRLETEVKKLRENNQDVKDQLEKALCKVNHCGAYAMTSDTDIKKEIQEKDSMITKLIAQGRELSKSRDKLEVELATQKACCEEQQNHVDVLEASLKLAHADKFHLQGELQKLKINETKMKQLQQAFSQLQTAAENREAIEHKLRAKLEDDIRSLKHQKKCESVYKASDTDEGISSDCESGPRVSWMKQHISELTQSVLRLEVEVSHYQQCYIEAQALSQLALDAAAMPKDVKIAALEQTSQETERLISESKNERLQHLEELYNANRKSAEFEAKVKTLEAQLGEKEAMLQVLQKHTLSLSRTGSVSSLYSPVHSAHQSMTSPVSPALPHRDFSRLTVHHAKSSSDGAVLDISGAALSSLGPQGETKPAAKPLPTRNTSKKSLRELLTAQAEIFQRWKTEDPDDVSKECWQV